MARSCSAVRWDGHATGGNEFTISATRKSSRYRLRDHAASLPHAKLMHAIEAIARKAPVMRERLTGDSN